MISYCSSDRWEAQFACLADFIQRWYGITADKANGNIGATDLPPVLSQLYNCYGNDLNKLFKINKIFRSDELVSKEGQLDFFIENQGAYIWQTRTCDENPKVFISENVKPRQWLLEKEQLCGFLYQMLLFEAITSSIYHFMTTWVSDKKLDMIIEKWIVAPFKPMRWPAYPAQFYYTQNALALIFPNESGFTFQCGSNKLGALEFMHEYVDNTWEDACIS